MVLLLKFCNNFCFETEWHSEQYDQEQYFAQNVKSSAIHAGLFRPNTSDVRIPSNVQSLINNVFLFASHVCLSFNVLSLPSFLMCNYKYK